jgi:hypothetical protein
MIPTNHSIISSKKKDVWAFAVAGAQPYRYAMIVKVAFTLVFNTGLFPDSLRALQARENADNMWMQFKLDFAAAHREFCLTNQTAQQSGFCIANMMIDQGRGEAMQGTVYKIAQLATTTASESVMIAKLASQLEATQAYIKTLKDNILALKAKFKPAWQGQSSAKSTINNKYCWSHGNQVRKYRTSATCKARKDGHQETATKDNVMEGVTWGNDDAEGQLRLYI